jgi:hypothetical protein
VSDEADNMVLRLLREMRAEMATKSDLSDLRHDVSEGFTRTTTALTTLTRRLDPLTAIEKRLTDLEGRRGS